MILHCMNTTNATKMKEGESSNQSLHFSSLNCMSISSPEEILARQLRDAELADAPKYSKHRVFGQRCQPPVTSTPPEQPMPVVESENDGWGENLPSYTSISLHHRFGFQSVLTSSHLPLVQPDGTRNEQPPPKLFGGYSGQSIVFGENPGSKTWFLVFSFFSLVYI